MAIMDFVKIHQKNPNIPIYDQARRYIIALCRQKNKISH